MSSDPPTAFTADDAFSALANEIRVEILQALGEATARDALPLAYSTLKDRVELRDSSRFNYHLSKLTDHFVEKVEAGYTLRFPGVLVYRSLVAGAYTGHVEYGSFSVDSDCHECGHVLRASYDPVMHFHLVCPDCGAGYADQYVPPVAIEDRSEEALLELVHHRWRTELSGVVRGVCPWCATEMSASFRSPAEVQVHSDDRPLEVCVDHRCSTCQAHYVTTVGELLLFHPAISGFLHEEGVDVTQIPKWELEFAATDHYTTVNSCEPWTVAVDIPGEGRRLRATFEDVPSPTTIETVYQVE